MKRRRLAFLFVLAGVLLLMGPALGVRGAAIDRVARLQEPAPTPQGQQPPEGQGAPITGIANETCLQCHGQPGMTMELANGQIWGLYVPPETYNASVHGQGGYACVQCHTTVGNYPHPPFQAADARDASLQLYAACQRCHASEYQQVQDSVHATALKAGNRAAAICTDCHTAHATRRLNDPQTHQLLPEARVWIPQTCAQCHYAIYEKYAASVHGSALLGEGNPDVPTCIDCHGVHNIEDPTTAQFRLRSPELCAKCHTDPAIMDKYGISTQVLSTYVADFHGTTVAIFEKQHPDQQTNKPVCYDCHGVHDIKAVSDPEKGLQVKQNLLATCQKCHPNASENFPTAWLSHYEPTPERHPLVFSVDLFYSIFIPAVLGGMGVLVLLDISSLRRQHRERRMEERQRLHQAQEAESAAPVVEEAPVAEAPPEVVAEETPPAAETADELAPSEPPVVSPEAVAEDTSPAAEAEEEPAASETPLAAPPEEPPEDSNGEQKDAP